MTAPPPVSSRFLPLPRPHPGSYRPRWASPSSVTRTRPGSAADERVRAIRNGPQADWINHVNVTAHDHGGHFIPWENPDARVNDLRRTFRGRRP